jgi:hypothetical protein
VQLLLVQTANRLHEEFFAGTIHRRQLRTVSSQPNAPTKFNRPEGNLNQPKRLRNVGGEESW